MPKLEKKLKILNRLQQLRQKHHLTQEDLAQAVDVTRATIIALEKGNYNPSLELAFRLAQFFKMKIDTIFYLQGNKYE